MPSLALIALSIGNTRTQIAHFDDDVVARSERIANDDRAAIVDLVRTLWAAADPGDDGEGDRAIALASVNDAMAHDLKSALEDQLGVSVYRVGDDLPVPIGESLDPETITGVDRLLNAAAAWDRLESACVVVDAGTAVTVDFVDGKGVFHGGAIAPGLQMQLDALHRDTSALPALTLRAPEGDAFGRNTAEAMLRGVVEGVRGLVWRLVERYATQYEAYPTVVATGGDAPLLFGEDELVDRVVPDLTVLGIAVAAKHALATADEDDDRDE